VDLVDDFLGDLAAAVVTVSSFSLHFALTYPLCSALVTCKCGKETFLPIPDKVFSASLYFK
jgi:hypothetical protein